MEYLKAVIVSPTAMEDGFKTTSSQEESTYDDDTPTSLTTEDESYQIGGTYSGRLLRWFLC